MSVDKMSLHRMIRVKVFVSVHEKNYEGYAKHFFFFFFLKNGTGYMYKNIGGTQLRTCSQ